MATGDLQSRNPMSDISNILNIFKGTGTTTQTNTSSEVVSNDKAKAYLQQILESNSGLAAVSGGQKSAGMYGSTVNTQLTNDLLARASAQTAALSSTKTSTSSSKTGAQMDPLKTVAGLALGQVLTPIAKAGSKKLGLDKLGQNISDSIFGDGSAVTDTTPFDIANFSPSASMSMPTLPDLSSSDINVGSSMPDATGGGSSAAGILGTAGASAGIGALMSSGAADAAATGGGYVLGAEGATWGASAAAAAGTDAAVTAGTAAAADTAAAAGGADIIGTLAAAAAWIVCTELNKQGRLPYRYYIYGAREFAKYDERGKQGYYIWAIPSVEHLRAHPTSLYSRALEVVFNARAEYLAAKAGCKGARKTALGFITTHGLYAFCWTLSRTIARKAYTKEQILNAGA